MVRTPVSVNGLKQRCQRANAALDWVKSSFSYANGNCVEVAGPSDNFIWIRDSKNPDGPKLRFTPAEWDAFLGSVRNGRSDRHRGRSS
jgi:uncharacterized protein DUF397